MVTVQRSLGSRLGMLLLACVALSAYGRPVMADHVVWFNPAGAKLSGAGGIVPGATPQALRIQHTGGPAPQSGSVTIPLQITSEFMLDSIYVCYRQVSNEFTSRITGIALRCMALPTATTTLLNDAATHSSTAGECLGLDVADVTPVCAPDIAINYTVEILSFVEIGAIGLKVKSPALGVNEIDGMQPPTLALGPGQPNPFSRTTRIDYTVSATGPVKLEIVDVTGRVVRTLVDRTLVPGRYDASWDGRDDSGRQLAHGVYFSRVSNAHEGQGQRLVLLR